MIYNYESYYVKIIWLERCYGVGPECVNRTTQLSSEIGYGFKKNQFRALYIKRTVYRSVRISKIGAFWETIWHNVIFFEEIFQVFL